MSKKSMACVRGIRTGESVVVNGSEVSKRMIKVMCVSPTARMSCSTESISKQ